MSRSHSNLPVKLAKPAQRALVNAGYISLEQLTAVSEEELSALHGIGPKALGQLRAALQEHGMSFSRQQES